MEERECASSAPIVGNPRSAEAMMPRVSVKLRRTLERSQQLSSLSEKLAYRVSGPSLNNPAERCSPERDVSDEATLMNLADAIEESVSTAMRNVERAHHSI